MLETYQLVQSVHPDGRTSIYGNGLFRENGRNDRAGLGIADKVTTRNRSQGLGKRIYSWALFTGMVRRFCGARWWSR